MLAGGVMKKFQRDKSGAVADAANQAAATFWQHIGKFDCAFYQRTHAGSQRTDGGYSGTIFVAMWQMEKQVLNNSDAQFFKAMSSLGANARQCCNRFAQIVSCGH